MVEYTFIFERLFCAVIDVALRPGRGFSRRLQRDVRIRLRGDDRHRHVGMIDALRGIITEDIYEFAFVAVRADAKGLRARVFHRGQAFRPVILLKFFRARALGDLRVIPAGVFEGGRGVKPVRFDALRLRARVRGRSTVVCRHIFVFGRRFTGVCRRFGVFGRRFGGLRRCFCVFGRHFGDLRRFGVFGRRFGSRVGRCRRLSGRIAFPGGSLRRLGGACCGGRKFDLQFLRLSRIGQLAHKAHAHLGRGRGCRRRSGCRLHRWRGRFGRRRRGRFGRRRRGRFGRRRRGRFGRRRRGRLGRRRYGRLDRLGRGRLGRLGRRG